MKTRKINPLKMVRKLNYLKSVVIDAGTLESYTLKSIDPEKIIGASVLWVYNAKTRKLGKYEATEGSQLMVKGSTIMNFDKASYCKKLRKPAEILTKLAGAGKVEQRKLLDVVNAKPALLNGRINKDVILVRTF